LNEAREFDADLVEGPWLESFLERAALVADVDQWEADASKVSLMTLHAAKGLEFPYVFIVGLEEGMLPHERTGRDPDATEEERRLLFVGITRAKEYLQISTADLRMRGGGYMKTVPSSFLLELPIEDVQRIGYGPVHPAPTEDWETYREPSEFEAVDIAIEQPPPPQRKPEPLSMMTAAQLLQNRKPQAHSAQDIDQFQQDMQVRHPDYGVGRIIALSGSGPKRTATVQFKENDEQRRFILAYSELVPVEG